MSFTEFRSRLAAVAGRWGLPAAGQDEMRCIGMGKSHARPLSRLVAAKSKLYDAL